MNFRKIKRPLSILFILIGAIFLILEIASKEKNYYLQSIGLVLLMLGLYSINRSLTSKTVIDRQDILEEE